MKRRWILLLLAGLIFVFIARLRTPPNKGPMPLNVILIVADDLGVGDVGCYGSEWIRTPNIDRMAKQGMRALDAHSTASVCTPSRY